MRTNRARATNAARGRSDESGRVALGPLAAGQVAFRVEPPEGSPFLCPSATVPVQATLRGGDTRRGRDRGQEGRSRSRDRWREHGTAQAGGRGEGQPLRLSACYRRNEDVVTDAEGRFSLYVLPCKLRVSLTWFELPDRYFHAPDAHWADHDLAAGEETQKLAPLEVWPAVAIKGTVVDEAGKPVEGVQVSGSCRARVFGDRHAPGQHPDGRARGLRARPDGARLDRRGPGVHLDRAETQPVTVQLDARGRAGRAGGAPARQAADRGPARAGARAGGRCRWPGPG